MYFYLYLYMPETFFLMLHLTYFFIVDISSYMIWPIFD